MIFMANLLAFLALVALGFVFKSIDWTFGSGAMMWACVGWIAATVMWQIAHKLRYGHWFDDPVINGDRAGAPTRAANSKACGEIPGADGVAPPRAIKP